MVSSSKCDSPITRTVGPAMMASSKCDFRLLADGLTVSRSDDADSIELSQGLGSVRASSSKCDFKLHVDDRLDRFSFSARVAGSSKCDFSVIVDFGIPGGQTIRGVAGGSSKCDFILSRLDKISDTDPKK